MGTHSSLSKSARSVGPKPKKSVLLRGRPSLSRSCTIVEVTVDGALPWLGLGLGLINVS